MWGDTWRTDHERLTDEERRNARDLRRTNYALLPFLSACILFSVLHFSANEVPAAATALIWAAGCLISGAAIGFIFGIPRVVAGAPRGETAQAAAEESATLPSRASKRAEAREASAQQHQVNTNLMEISDWLTKIIVGLGLVNLQEIPAQLSRTAEALAHGLSAAPCAESAPCTDYAFALGLIVAFAVLGFLMGYLYTRLFLAGAFRRADNLLLQLREEVTTILEQEGVSRSLEVTPAQIEAAERVRDLPLAGKENTAVEELQRLAREYNRVRLTMLADAGRTRKMTEIVTTMRALALAAYGSLEKFSSSSSPGDRLVAVAMVQVKPNHAYWEWLLERVTLEKPFIAYQALEALRRAVLVARGAERDELKTMLEEWASSERGQQLHAASHDRGQLFRDVLQLLQRPPADNADET